MHVSEVAFRLSSLPATKNAKPMDVQELQTILDPWLRTATWNHGQRSDEVRFHHALHAAFRKSYGPIPFLVFKAAIIEQARQRHPDVNWKLLEDDADKFAHIAECISWYVYHTAALRD